MAEYHSLLKRAVAVMPNATPEARRAIYERARKALLGQLRAMQPPVPEADIERESLALDEAIAQLEAELAPPPAPVAKPAAPVPPAAPAAPVAPPRPAPAPAAAAPAVPKPTPPVPPAAAPNLPAAPVAPPRPAPAPGAAPPAAPLPAPQVPLATAKPAAPAAAPPRPAPTAPPVATPPVAAPPVAAPAPAQPRPAAPAVPPPAAKPAPPAAPIRTATPAPSAPPTPAPPRPARPVAGPAPVAPAVPQPARRAEPTPAPPAPEAYDIDETFEPSPEVSPELRMRPTRPAAPQPPVERASNLRYVVVAVALLAVLGGIGYAAWLLRDRPEDIARARPEAPAAQPAPETGAKIVERVGGGAPPADSAPVPTVKAPTQAIRPPQPAAPAPAPAAAPAQPGVPVAQRAAMLVAHRDSLAPENRDRPLTPDVHAGTAVWRADKGALRAEIEIPELKLKAAMTLQKNADLTLAASHTMELRLDGPAGDDAVARIGAPEMRREDLGRGDKLVAVAVPIAAGYWLVGLARGEKDVAYNLELLKTRGWIDIPMQLADGRVAKLTFEKGAPGDRALAEASANW